MLWYKTILVISFFFKIFNFIKALNLCYYEIYLSKLLENHKTYLKIILFSSKLYLN